MNKEISILLIDNNLNDSTDFRKILDRLNANYNLIHYSSAARALEHYSMPNAITPQFIFIDVLLPGMSGFEASFKLRNIHALSSVPIILYSSVHPSAYEDVAKIMGASICIQKKELDDFRKELSRVLLTSLPHAQTIAPRVIA